MFIPCSQRAASTATHPECLSPPCMGCIEENLSSFPQGEHVLYSNFKYNIYLIIPSFESWRYELACTSEELVHSFLYIYLQFLRDFSLLALGNAINIAK